MRSGWTRLLSLTLAATATVTAWEPVNAQSNKLVDLLPQLYGGDGIQLAVTTDPLEHPLHFQDGTSAALNRLNDQLARQIQTLPTIRPAATGTSLTFDPDRGTYVPRIDSLGPWRLESSQTIGAGRWDLGLAWSRSEFDHFEGQDLDALRLTVAHRLDVIDPPGSPQSFENDRLHIDLAMRLEVEQLTFLLTYGATNNLDFSLSLPLIQVEIDVASRASIDEFFPPESPFATPGVHAFDDAVDPAIDAASGRASGIGDMLLGARYHIRDDERWSLGSGMFIRLATGDRFDLLGAGATVFAPYAAADYRFSNRLSAHGNLGAELVNDDGTWRSSLAPAAGLSFGDAHWLVSAELSGRYELDGDDVGDEQTDFGLGLKWRPPSARLYVLSAGISLPLDENGLRADAVALVRLTGRN